MDRHSFFRSGWKEIFSHLRESPAGQLIDRQLQALANLLAPQGLDHHIDHYTGRHAEHYDANRDSSQSSPLSLLEASRSRNSLKNASCFPRPPGSLPAEQEFNKACTHCGDCRQACPHGAIQGDENTGPFLDPNSTACHLCMDYPCIAACQEGALQPLPLNFLPSLGQAKLHSGLCLNSGQGDKRKQKQSQFCELCQKSCPVPKAIKYDHQGLPEFTEHCTGCGLCRAACPAIPVAIEITCEEMDPEK